MITILCKYITYWYTTVQCTGEDDYQRIFGSQQEQFFNDAIKRASANVTIRTDNIYEGAEGFNLDLFFASPQAGFYVIPNIATVTINDTTSEYINCLVSHAVSLHCVIVDLTIGFIGAPYQAREDEGPITFTVGVVGVTELATDVVVSFSTLDGFTPGR